MSGIKEQIDKLEVRVSKMDDYGNDIRECTKTMQGLAIQMAVYITKHDTIDKELKDIKVETQSNSKDIAAMLPTVNAVRNIVWKIIGIVLGGGVGVTAAIAALQEMAS
jgi:septal ring factor EnvC (AmiA/AmiB activator)